MAAPTPPKSMSSRLLTMKFMQRAVASPSSPTTPDTDDQASKRRKVAHNPASRESKDPTTQINQAAVQAALAEEERKQQEALIQHAAELGDARWVLDIPHKAAGPGRESQTPMNVVQVGFAQIDSQIDSSDAAGFDAESTDTSHPRVPMVRRYNMGNKQASKPNAPKDSESGSGTSGSESDSDASSHDHRPGRNSYGQRSEAQSDSPRSVPRRKRSAEQMKAKQFAEKRRKKEVKLNNSPKPSPNSGGGLLSISSGGGSTSTRPTFVCHRCGKPGHRIAECKNRPQRSAR